jgi:hypothetical protein
VSRQQAELPLLRIEPLQLSNRAGVFNRAFVAARLGLPQKRNGLGAIVFQKMPFTEIELSFAAFVSIGCGRHHLVLRAPPKVEVDHRVRPVFGSKACGAGCELVIAVCAGTVAGKITPQRCIGIGFQIVGPQKISGRGGIIDLIEASPPAVAIGQGVFRVEPDGLVVCSYFSQLWFAIRYQTVGLGQAGAPMPKT